LEDLGVHGRIILRWILGKQGLGLWISSGYGLVAGFCEHGN
jgi:hypothetical protein